MVSQTIEEHNDAAVEAGALINQTFGMVIAMTSLRTIFELGLQDVSASNLIFEGTGNLTHSSSHSLFPRAAALAQWTCRIRLVPRRT